MHSGKCSPRGRSGLQYVCSLNIQSRRGFPVELRLPFPPILTPVLAPSCKADFSVGRRTPVGPYFVPDVDKTRWTLTVSCRPAPPMGRGTGCRWVAHSHNAILSVYAHLCIHHGCLCLFPESPPPLYTLVFAWAIESGPSKAYLTNTHTHPGETISFSETFFLIFSVSRLTIFNELSRSSLFTIFCAGPFWF